MIKYTLWNTLEYLSVNKQAVLGQFVSQNRPQNSRFWCFHHFQSPDDPREDSLTLNDIHNNKKHCVRHPGVLIISSMSGAGSIYKFKWIPKLQFAGLHHFQSKGESQEDSMTLNDTYNHSIHIVGHPVSVHLWAVSGRFVVTNGPQNSQLTNIHHFQTPCHP